MATHCPPALSTPPRPSSSSSAHDGAVPLSPPPSSTLISPPPYDGSPAIVSPHGPPASSSSSSSSIAPVIVNSPITKPAAVWNSYHHFAATLLDNLPCLPPACIKIIIKLFAPSHLPHLQWVLATRWYQRFGCELFARIPCMRACTTIVRFMGVAMSRVFDDRLYRGVLLPQVLPRDVTVSQWLRLASGFSSMVLAVCNYLPHPPTYDDFCTCRTLVHNTYWAYMNQHKDAKYVRWWARKPKNKVEVKEFTFTLPHLVAQRYCMSMPGFDTAMVDTCAELSEDKRPAKAHVNRDRRREAFDWMSQLLVAREPWGDAFREWAKTIANARAAKAAQENKAKEAKEKVVATVGVKANHKSAGSDKAESKEMKAERAKKNKLKLNVKGPARNPVFSMSRSLDHAAKYACGLKGFHGTITPEDGSTPPRVAGECTKQGVLISYAFPYGRLAAMNVIEPKGKDSELMKMGARIKYEDEFMVIGGVDESYVVDVQWTSFPRDTHTRLTQLFNEPDKRGKLVAKLRQQMHATVMNQFREMGN